MEQEKAKKIGYHVSNQNLVYFVSKRFRSTLMKNPEFRLFRSRGSTERPGVAKTYEFLEFWDLN